ncbi:hypothetical protein QCN29_12875 [Streptomyces sp. HNM0663]|uniref:Alpha/beta hydrolase n=1 Tax=Streptomyces chengmaiensis TaxID=3040919 RepID=A0ABT6HMT4_9ACTN|nr:hypothetical protein [Streptomyces chengmaiensis]MDH2389671.1 hypothetical protein [Streptomyces chengmaiensis]
MLAPGPKEATSQIPLPPDDMWDLPGGTAWVYYGAGHDRLTRPVIMADGFHVGPSDLEFAWEVLEFGAYPFLGELRRRGRDVVIVGFHERSASILDNSRTAQAAILQAVEERSGGAQLAVGGFSMGGLIARHALAKLESLRIDHQTALYWSYDSPHRGAWIPLSLQAFAHYTRRLDRRFSDQINSPASRELLWRHIDEWDAPPGQADDRKAFLAEMREIGEWPSIPRLIGVANGVSSGRGEPVEPGAVAFQGRGLSVVGTRLYAQQAGHCPPAAQLRVVSMEKPEVRTCGLPEIDGAPGGMLDGFGILADELNKLPAFFGFRSDARIRAHCFVPAVSAVAVRDLDRTEDLYVDIEALDPGESELDEFRLASQNEEHTLMTEELGSWIIERLP